MILLKNGKKPTISDYSKFHSEIKNTTEYTKFADKQIKKYKTEIRSGSVKQAIIPTPFTPIEKRILRCMLIIRPVYLLKKEIDKIDLKMDEELFDSKINNSLNLEENDDLEVYDQKQTNKRIEKFNKREVSFLEKQSLKLKDDIIKIQLKLKKINNSLKKIYGEGIVKSMIDR